MGMEKRRGQIWQEDVYLEKRGSAGNGQLIRAGIREDGNPLRDYRLSGGGGWIRTTEANATDLQSAPFGHSGTPPYEIVELVDGFEPPTC